jgi:hypothetical protein
MSFSGTGPVLVLEESKFFLPVMSMKTISWELKSLLKRGLDAPMMKFWHSVW